MSEEQIIAAIQEHGEDIVDLYLSTTAGELKKMNAALKAEQLKELSFIAHRSCGASAILGFKVLAKDFRLVEELAPLDAVAQAGPLLQKIGEQLNELKIARRAQSPRPSIRRSSRRE